jgi:hypothetical protein
MLSVAASETMQLFADRTVCDRSDTKAAAAARNCSMDAANNWTKLTMIKMGING